MLIKVVRTKSARLAARAPQRKMMRFDALIDLAPDGRKKWTERKDGDRVVDYVDVSINGYLSTWGNVDRDGDVVKPGAFAETLQRFMLNPVLLIDHENSIHTVAGKFTKAIEDEEGLYVEAMLSNSPGNLDTRWKVVEGVLRSLSMGGIFHYGEDGRTIEKVDLFEGSLVAVPANPRALVSVRSLTAEEKETYAQDNALVGTGGTPR